MRASLFAFVVLAALPLSAATAIGVGVRATSASDIEVRVDGKVRPLHLETHASGDAAQLFLTCLVRDRVLHVAEHDAKLLDGTSVIAHLEEFASSRTSVDPCELGKAAYQGPTPAGAAVPEPPKNGAKKAKRH